MRLLRVWGRELKKRGRRLEGKEQKGKAGDPEVRFLFDIIT